MDNNMVRPPRPRVEALLDAAFEYPVVAIYAGRGYAKRQLVAGYMGRRGVTLVWMRLTKLENLPGLFWRNLRTAFAQSGLDLGLADTLDDFPATPEQVAAFIQAIAAKTEGLARLVLVVEAHEHIRDKSIQYLLQALAAGHLPRFSLWLLGRTLPDINMPTLLDNDYLYQISAGELRFSATEIADMLEHNGIPYTEQTLQEFHRSTEGWPLMVEQLVYLFRTRALAGGPRGLHLPDLEVLFRQGYFAGYAPACQTLLVKLSCLSMFNAEMAAQLGGMPVNEVVELLQAHPFVAFDPLESMYSFHTMYRSFLAGRQAGLPAEALVQVYTLAANWFLERGRYYDAIPCLEKCGRYDEMYQAILSMPLRRPEKALADFVMEHLSRLPEAYVRSNPMVLCTRATMLINNLEIDEAEAILLQLQQAYEQRPPSPEGKAFLGELYIMLSDISMMRNRDDFAGYFTRAAECLPNRSRYRDEKLMMVENSDVFYLTCNRPGERERMEALFLQAMPVGAAVMRGCGWGLEHLFVAKSAYLACDLNRAETVAYRAIYKAQERRQHDIMCNARALLVRISVARGNYKEAHQHMEQVTAYVNDNNLTELFGLRDSIQSWLYIYVKDDERLPAWVISDGTAVMQTAPTSYSRPWLLRTTWLLHKQQHRELLALLQQMEEYYTRSGMWAPLLYTHVMRAVYHIKNDSPDAALEALWTAYDMSHQNDILMPFVEQGSAMRALADAARKQTRWQFDSAWLDSVQQKAGTYAKRCNAMAAEHRRGSAAAPQEGPGLSRRELEVLQNLAQGLTRDEIGLQMHISVNTVKSMIKSIYNKLNAANRADAVHIANMLGLIA